MAARSRLQPCWDCNHKKKKQLAIASSKFSFLWEKSALFLGSKSLRTFCKHVSQKQIMEDLLWMQTGKKFANFSLGFLASKKCLLAGSALKLSSKSKCEWFRAHPTLSVTENSQHILNNWMMFWKDYCHWAINCLLLETLFLFLSSKP